MPNIFYLNPHSILSGGNKIVYEHCNNLARTYQKCFIICDDKVPDWFEVDAFFVNKDTALQLMQTDDVVFFHWDGDKDIEYVVNCPAQNKYYLVQSYVHQNYSVFAKPIKFVAVSTYIQKHLKDNFSIDAILIKNAIDHSIFYERKNIRIKKRIFAIDKGGMKGVQDVRNAERIVKKSIPDAHFVYLDNLLPEQIAIEYSRAEIFVSASWFEGFGLPVLEAMACGAAVVCTDSKGIDDFAFDHKNCIKVPIKNPRAMAQAIIELLQNQNKIGDLAEEGLKISKQFTWEKSIRELGMMLNLKSKKSDLELIRGIKRIKTITTRSDPGFACYGTQMEYKDSIFHHLEKIKGGRRLFSLLKKIGVSPNYTDGDFDYRKVAFVHQEADLSYPNDPDGSLICYFPSIRKSLISSIALDTL
ncbi:MAG: glycosyltransferase family 4 protein [Spirochaetes bacterium]|nr:glycosyltransferase family 4 protein [Spirochaetota bacterium]